MTSALLLEQPPRAHGMSFSDEEVLSILDGSKTRTTRVINRQPPAGLDRCAPYSLPLWGWTNEPAPAYHWHTVRCPWGQKGDELWVRETWRTEERQSDGVDGIRYRADDAFLSIEPTREAADRWLAVNGGLQVEDLGDIEAIMRPEPWRRAAHMPRWASRIRLRVTWIEPRRLHDLDETEAKAEGVRPAFVMDVAEFVVGRPIPPSTYRNGFARHWRETQRVPWEDNPWAWTIEFELAEKETRR